MEEIFMNEDPGVGNVPTDAICAANESRFEDAYLSQPLTTYAVGGWDNDPLQQLLDFVAPAVPNTPRRFSYKTFDDSDYWLREEGDEDIRAIGSNFQEVQTESKDEVEGKIPNKGLVIKLDLDEHGDDPKVENRRTMKLVNRLIRNELRRTFALLDASSTNTALTWDSSSDPDLAILEALDDGEASSGVRANNVLYGNTAWNIREAAYRAQNNAGSTTSANKNPQQVGEYLSSRLSKIDALYRMNAGSLARFVGNSIYAYNAAPDLDGEDPSNIKRFVYGGGLKVYKRQINSKVWEIAVSHYSLIKITSILGMLKFTISKAS